MHYKRLNEYPFINSYKYSDIKIRQKAHHGSKYHMAAYVTTHGVNSTSGSFICVLSRIHRSSSMNPFNGKLKHFTSSVSCLHLPLC